jgi:hypothetical protein
MDRDAWQALKLKYHIFSDETAGSMDFIELLFGLRTDNDAGQYLGAKL